MAINAFMKVEGPNVEGTGTESKHEKWIDFLSWSWGGASPVGSSDKGAQYAAGRAMVQDFVITRNMDQVSPKLFAGLLKGTKYDKITLDLLRAVKDENVVYQQWILEDVFITSVSQSGAGDDFPMESITFTCGKFESKYTPIDEKGQKGAEVPVKWNLLKQAEN